MPQSKPEQTIFALELRPNQSMPPRHFKRMIAGVALVFLLMGLRFLALGAWPILPFMLADIALLWWALRASTRASTAREHLTLNHNGLELLRISPTGTTRATRLEPHWTRVELEPLGEDGNRLWLKSGQRQLNVGAFLSPPERIEIARVIEDGLRRVRGTG
jgi:uncharacterized membrane protein